MFSKPKLFSLLFALISCVSLNAQIEVDHISMKNFKATALGGFLNFSHPVSDGNYMSYEVGLHYFKSKYDEEVVLIPLLVGYRYTLDQTGTGFYVEPNAGYNFGKTTIQKYDENGGFIGGEEKVAGPAAGLGFGYLWQLGDERTLINFGARYERIFGQSSVNMFSFRASYTFSFGRRD